MPKKVGRESTQLSARSRLHIYESLGEPERRGDKLFIHLGKSFKLISKSSGKFLPRMWIFCPRKRVEKIVHHVAFNTALTFVRTTSLPVCVAVLFTQGEWGVLLVRSSDSLPTSTRYGIPQGVNFPCFPKKSVINAVEMNQRSRIVGRRAVPVTLVVMEVIDGRNQKPNILVIHEKRRMDPKVGIGNDKGGRHKTSTVCLHNPTSNGNGQEVRKDKLGWRNRHGGGRQQNIIETMMKFVPVRTHCCGAREGNERETLSAYPSIQRYASCIHTYIQ